MVAYKVHVATSLVVNYCLAYLRLCKVDILVEDGDND